MSWFRRSAEPDKPAGKGRGKGRAQTARAPAAAKVRSGAEVLVDRPAGARLRWRRLLATGGLLLLPPLAVTGAILLAPQDADALFYEAETELAELTAAGGLAVESVTVEGRDKTALDDLREAIDVNRGDPILFLDLDEVRRRIAGLPWVKGATVQRRLPDNVHVRVQEREPFVRWQNDGRTVLIDREGVTLARAVGGEFHHLRRLVGKGAPEQATLLFDMLQADLPLFERVVTATRIRERRWDVTFDNGVVLRLPEEGTRQAWQRFAQLQAAEGLLDKDIHVIDLRVPDRVILQLTPEAVQARAVPGKNT